jgi:hypothetical protein
MRSIRKPLLLSETTVGMVIAMTSIKTYSELITLPTFIERYQYLRLEGEIGKETFGFDRYLNQSFYTSTVWRNFRRDIIVRDMGCDLGIEDREIRGLIILHHIVPVTVEDIVRGHECLLDPENVICVSRTTHNAIHYGDESLLITAPLERSRNDTCPWRQ